MDIYNENFKRRNKHIMKEQTNKKFDLNKISGRNLAIGTDRWKWLVSGTKVKAFSEEGETLVIEAHILTGFDDRGTYDEAKHQKDKNTSITPATVGTWIRRNRA